MDKEFVPYELALALKDIGYQNPNPIGGYRGGAIFYYDKGSELFYDGLPMYSSSYHEGQIIAPLYQQAFRWFRDKYPDFDFGVAKIHNGTNNYHYHINLKWEFFEGTYEEAELACLKKLIEIAKETK
jgi:hypothetical protein